jgi:hypothetical protein
VNHEPLNEHDPTTQCTKRRTKKAGTFAPVPDHFLGFFKRTTSDSEIRKYSFFSPKPGSVAARIFPILMPLRTVSEEHPSSAATSFEAGSRAGTLR